MTDHLEAPKIGAGRVRVVTSRSYLRLAVPAEPGNGDIVIIGLETVKHVCEDAQLVRGRAGPLLISSSVPHAMPWHSKTAKMGEWCMVLVVRNEARIVFGGVRTPLIPSPSGWISSLT